MADWAGAAAAIKQRLRDNFTAARVEEENIRPAHPWPPVDANGDPQPFVIIEILGNGSEILGVGTPGQQMNRDYGLVMVHVFVPTGSGTQTAHTYAAQIAAIFRSREFYNSTPGYAVRTWRPYTDNGQAAEIEGISAGLYWRVTMTAEFEYLHLD